MPSKRHPEDPRPTDVHEAVVPHPGDGPAAAHGPDALAPESMSAANGGDGLAPESVPAAHGLDGLTPESMPAAHGGDGLIRIPSDEPSTFARKRRGRHHSSDLTHHDVFLPFAQPDIGEEEIAEVVDALRSGWITTGPKTRLFEAEFAAFLEQDPERSEINAISPGAHPSGSISEQRAAPLHAVAVNSATAGLHLALEAIGVRLGDEIIVPTFTFTATAEAIRYLGADPVFVDLDPETLNLDLDAVERAISERTRVIMVVHFGGLSVDMTRLLALARRHGIRVIEDAAHAIPTSHGGRLIGSLDSDATVFSFYATKTVAAGEGGMLVTRDPHLAERARVMRLHGISRDAFDRYVSERPAWHYDVVAPGYKYNMTDPAAALGRVQLRRAFDMHARRAGIARAYDEAFADLPVVLPPRPDAQPGPVEPPRPDALPGPAEPPRPDAQGATGRAATAPQRSPDLHSWYLYVLRLTDDAPIGRDALVEGLADRRIGTSVHFIPLHLQPYWRDTYGLTPSDFPRAGDAFRRAISLPIYSKMTSEDVARVIRGVRELLA